MRELLATLILASFIAIPPSAAQEKASSTTEPALTLAAQNGDRATIRKILTARGDIDVRDSQGQTALFHAVSQADAGLVSILLKAGARVDLEYGDNKQSLVFEAVRAGSVEILKALLKKDPSIAAKVDRRGENALFEAVRNARPEFIPVLLKAGAQKELKNSDGKKAADLADPKVDREIVRLLK